MADFTGYGLDPAIVNYVQGLPVDPNDPLALSTMGPRGTESVPGGPVAAPPPPPPPPPPVENGGPVGRKGGEPAPPTPSRIGLFGAPGGEETYGLPPEIIAHVQGGGEAPPSTTPSVTGGALPTDPGMTPTAPVTHPDLAPVAVPVLTDKQIAASNKAVDQRQAAQRAYEQSPEGLSARADDEQRAAVAKEQQANADALAAEQAQNMATANAMALSQQRQQAQDQVDAKKLAEDQANIAKYTQQYAQQVKDAADYKVDTNRDVGVRGLIAIALSGIGDALDHVHGPNKAAQIIESQIDKRIADQWAQKGALKDKANDTKGVIDQFRRGADDDRQAQALHTAAETKRIADEIRQIGAQYANPAAKARAEAVAAQLDGKAAAITQGEAQRKAQAIRDAQEEADRRAQIGIAYGHLKLGRDQLTEQANEHKDAMSVDLIKSLLAGSGKSSEDAAKEAQRVQQLGMIDYKTGKGADGKPTVQPVVLKNSDGSVWTAPTEKEAVDLRAKRAAVETMIPVIDEVRRLHQKYGGSSDILRSPEWQKAKADWAALKLKEKDLNQLGAISGSDMELIDGILGASDPTSFRDIGPGLDKARENMVLTFNKSLRHEGNYTGPDIDFPDSASADTPQDTPVQERVQSILEYDPQRPTMAESADIESKYGRGANLVSSMGGISAAPKLPPSYLQTIDTMIATAENPSATPDQRSEANAFLDSVQRDAKFSGLRGYVETKRGELAKIQRDIGRRLRGGE